VAEGTRLLSEYGHQVPSRVRIPPSPFLARMRSLLELGRAFTLIFVGSVCVQVESAWAIGIGAMRDGKDLDRADCVIDSVDDAVRPAARGEAPLELKT
jgi:hypothetical protein